jgi:hypothetical protein
MSVLTDLRDKAESMLAPGHEIAVCTDAQTDRQRVAIAFARPTVSWVMTVDQSEWSGLFLAQLLGFETVKKARA